MPLSEILKTFDSTRPEFKPYGFTVERWIPKLMVRPDRHNEIEINILTRGSIVYLINDRRVTLTPGKLTVFWALVPHQIVQFDDDAPYYVCTIPFSQFMEWHLPSTFVDPILGGDIVTGTSDKGYPFDLYLMENWLEDFSAGNQQHLYVTMLEICARLNRFALQSTPMQWQKYREGDHEYAMMDLVEKMVVFMARNYTQQVQNEDIGKAVGLHPDYANSIFKKSFGMTLNQYLLMQRILHVQRRLSVSNDSITDIAYEAGFNSLSRFNAAFREQCACSPREYRRKHSCY